MTSDLATLEEPRGEDDVRRARNYRRVGLFLVLSVVTAGLAGLLGVSSATTTATGADTTLAVTYPRVVRAGVAVPFHVEVRRSGGFGGPIRLAVSAALLERFDFQNFYPNPSKETATGSLLVYEFDPPPGGVFRLSLDARTAPDQNGSVGRYEVRLLDDGVTAVARADFRTVVMP